MRNFCLIFILFIIVPSVWFSSCSGSDDNDDNEKPVISNVRFNFDDTIVYEGQSIKINDSKNTDPNRTDILVIGKMIYLTATFQDDLALSSYKVVLDSVPENKGTGNDSVFTFQALGADIFGVKDTIIQRNNLLIIPNNLVRPQTNDNIDIREGEYHMKIVCGDMYGGKESRDSIISKIMIYSRKTIYEMYRNINE